MAIPLLNYKYILLCKLIRVLFGATNSMAHCLVSDVNTSLLRQKNTSLAFQRWVLIRSHFKYTLRLFFLVNVPFIARRIPLTVHSTTMKWPPQSIYTKTSNHPLPDYPSVPINRHDGEPVCVCSRCRSKSSCIP